MAVANVGSGYISTSSASISVPASATLIIVGAYNVSSEPSAPTLNGVSMTKLGTTTYLGGSRQGVVMYYLANPSTGTQTLASTGASGIVWSAYSGTWGVVLGAVASNPDTSQSSITLTTTVTGTNAWAVAVVVDSAGGETGGAGTTTRVVTPNGVVLADSNGAVAVGSTSLVVNFGSSASKEAGVIAYLLASDSVDVVAYGTHGNQSGTTATTLSPTIATSGSTVVVMVASADTGSDNHGTPTLAGASMTQLQGTIRGVSSPRAVTLWYMENVSSGSKTIQVSPVTIGNRYSWGYFVVSGLLTSSPLDTSTSGTTTTTTSITGTLSLAKNHEFMVMANFNAYNASTNSTLIFSDPNDAQVFYYNDCGPGSTSMTQTAGSAPMNYICAAFKSLSSSGGSSISGLLLMGCGT